MKLKTIPISREEAIDFVNKHHRHHIGAKGDKFRLGVALDGRLVGVVQVGRPVSRFLDDGKTLEVLRLCTTGESNVCSYLYSKAARIAKELGYEKIITYILKSEEGVSLKASGWKLENDNCGGGSWSCPSRPRLVSYPIDKKQRWTKSLTQ